MQEMNEIDPVTLEIINNRLRYISKEMVITLTRIAYSSVIYDGHDCSAGLFNPKGELLTLDAGIPFHISAMPFSVRAVLEQFQNHIYPGDIFITNDPAYGGTHLPDILIILPIFYKKTLAFFAAARGHWTDVGGSTPGSLSGKASELIQEGVVIPPIKLFEEGQLNHRLTELLFSNMRMREIRFGDMMSQTAACRHAEKSCLELIDRYGLEIAERCGEEIINRTEKRLRRKLEALPEGTYHYEDYLDNDGITRDARRIKLAATSKNGSLFIDFSGSSPQSQGPINASLSTTHGAVVIAVKIIMDPRGTPNEGLFRLIKIHAPLGSLLNPKPGAPTGGFTEVGYRIVYCIIGALAKSMPEHVSGCDYGTVNHTYISGVDDTTGNFFIQYEYPPGGNGGTFSMDGPSGMRGPISGNTSLQSNEIVENLNPLRTSYGTLRVDSGGPGKFRGGLGMVRQVEILSKEAFLSIVTDRSAIPPFGVYQGRSGYAQKWSVLRKCLEKPIPFEGKASRFKLKKGDVVYSLTAGGGGYGDPLERDPERVRKDVIEGYVSLKSSMRAYGVVLNEEDLSIDEEATRKQRKMLKEQTKTFTVGRYGNPLFLKGVKGILLNREEATTFHPGDLVEIHHRECAVPYRERIFLKATVKSGNALVDDETHQMMGVAEGDGIKIVNLSSTINP
jgi:N-methylhydantoinase B